MTYLKLTTTVGKRGKSVMPPDGEIIKYVVQDEVRAFQDARKDKIIVLQLMEFEDKRKEFRVGYYIIGKLPKMRGRWVWGQYAAFMPIRIFRQLIRKAIKKGWSIIGSKRSERVGKAQRAHADSTRSPEYAALLPGYGFAHA